MLAPQNVSHIHGDMCLTIKNCNQNFACVINASAVWQLPSNVNQDPQYYVLWVQDIAEVSTAWITVTAKLSPIVHCSASHYYEYILNPISVNTALGKNSLLNYTFIHS